MANTRSKVLLVLLAALGGCTKPSEPHLSSGLPAAEHSSQVLPGDDFYHYANDHALARQLPSPVDALQAKTRAEIEAVVTDALQRRGPTGSASQQIADLYASAIDSATRERVGMAPITPLLRDIDNIQDATTLAQAMAQLAQTSEHSPLAIWIGAVPLHGHQPVLTITPAVSTVSPEPQSVFALLVRSGIKPADASKLAPRVVALNGKLRALAEQRGAYQQLEPRSLIALYPTFDWRSWLDSADLAGQPTLFAPSDYLAGLGALLQATPLPDWQAYLRWQLMVDWAPSLDSASAALVGAAPLAQREQALGLVHHYLGNQLGQRYVTRFFANDAKARVTRIAEGLRRAYAKALDNASWMSPASKTQAQTKLAQMAFKIGYPDAWPDISTQRIEPDDLVGNLRRIKAWDYRRQLASLTSSATLSSWPVTPQTVNGFYRRSHNDLVLPAALLQPPFFDLNADEAINYGVIGALIGHEMSHAFDEQGARVAADGTAGAPLSSKELRDYAALSEALATRIAAGNPALSEALVADLAGVTLALRAYHDSLHGEEAAPIEGYSAEQRFFLGWARLWQQPEADNASSQPPAPAILRVNAIVTQFAEFYDAFAVQPDAKLYLPPEQRAHLW